MIRNILNYYISCIEAEDIKQSVLKLNPSNNYRYLTNLENSFIYENVQYIELPRNNDLENFLNKELAAARPRNLFFGFPTIQLAQTNELIPIFFLQIEREIENNRLVLKRVNNNQIELNKAFLVKNGLSDREEIEAIKLDIDSEQVFQNKINYLNNLLEINININENPIVFFSELNGITYNLLKELGVHGLMSDWHQRFISETPAIHLMNSSKIKTTPQEKFSIPSLGISKLNTEQEEAVYKGLKNKFTVVTGPPGTGKSQVVINILANALYERKTVLFASKNNKAIDVVKEKLLNDIFDGFPEMQDLVVRIGNKSEMIKMSEQFQRIINKVENNSFDFQVENLEQIQKNLDSHNELIQRIESETSKVTNFLNVLSELNEIASSSFFQGERFHASIDELIDNKNETKRLSDKIELGILEKFWFWVSPKKYQKIYLKKLIQTKANLPLPIMLWFDENNQMFDRSLEELSVQFLGLIRIKQSELDVIKTINFLKQNFPNESIFNLNTSNELLKIKLVELEETIDNLREGKISISKELFKLKWKEIVKNYANVSPIQSYVIAISKFNNINGFNIQQGEFIPVLNQIKDSFNIIKHFLPIWIVTSLSARNGLPLEAEIFDLIVIDEASQCDIPSALPLFYRAKQVCIIGDDLQLKHISGITNEEDKRIAVQCKVEEIGKRYTEKSLFNLAEEACGISDLKQLTLKQHYRSDSKISNFSSKYFYEPIKGIELINRTNPKNLKYPVKGVFWINVVSEKETNNKRNISEINSAITLYQHLMNSNKSTEVSFGITTPFRNQANAIREKLIAEKINVGKQINVLGDTVHKFQGDEKDVMIFSPVISTGATSGMKNFINFHSKQLLNVAISRGRSAVFIVGDRNACLNAGGLLSNLATYAEEYSY